MARKTKRRLSRLEQDRRRLAQERQQLDDLVQDTTATFTCSTKTAQDFAYNCAQPVEDIDLALVYARLAQEIWQGRPGRAEELVAAITALIEEHERHRDALRALGARFVALGELDEHEHLDPPEAYRDLVRARITAPDPDPA